MGWYTIWNPVLARDGSRVELLLTPQEAFSVGEGTPEFVRALLHDVGVSGRAASWTVTSWRSRYFSDSLDSDAWEDRWQCIWAVTIELASRSRDSLLPGMIETEAYDSTAEVTAPETGGGRCLAILDFRSERECLSSRTALTASLPNGGRITSALALGRFPQLRVDLGPRTEVFFASGAREAEALLAKYRSRGASDHHAMTAVWEAEGRSADDGGVNMKSKRESPEVEHEFVSGVYLLRAEGEVVGQLEWEADEKQWVLEPSSGDTQMWTDLRKTDGERALERAKEFVLRELSPSVAAPAKQKPRSGKGGSR